MGAPVTGSLRVNPSKRPALTRKSSMPVARAGSNVSGSGPLIMTRSAGGSERVQPASANRPTTQAILRRRAPGDAPSVRDKILMKNYLFVLGAMAGAED